MISTSTALALVRAGLGPGAGLAPRASASETGPGQSPSFAALMARESADPGRRASPVGQGPCDGGATGRRVEPEERREADGGQAAAAELRPHHLGHQLALHAPPPADALAVAASGAAEALDALAGRLVTAASVVHVGDATRVQLEISTGRLQRIEISLELRAGRLVARLGADGEGRRVLEPLVPQLQASIEARGIAVEAVEVTAAGARAGRFEAAGGERGQGGSRRRLPGEEAEAAGRPAAPCRPARDSFDRTRGARAIRLP